MNSADDLLKEARASLPRRPTPAEALAAQADGALLIDIRGDDQRRATGLIPAPSCYPATASNGAATPQADGATPPSPAGNSTSS